MATNLDLLREKGFRDEFLHNEIFMERVRQFLKHYGVSPLIRHEVKPFDLFEVYTVENTEGNFPCLLPIHRTMDWLLSIVSTRNNRTKFKESVQLLQGMSISEIEGLCDMEFMQLFDPSKPYSKQIKFYIEFAEGTKHPMTGTIVGWKDLQKFTKTKIRQNDPGSYTKIYIHPVGPGMMPNGISNRSTSVRVTVYSDSVARERILNALKFHEPYRPLAIALYNI
jgi:hypothetical protein